MQSCEQHSRPNLRPIAWSGYHPWNNRITHLSPSFSKKGTFNSAMYNAVSPRAKYVPSGRGFTRKAESFRLKREESKSVAGALYDTQKYYDAGVGTR